jgi:hypothetical protein
MKTEVDINNEASIYQHVNKIAVDIVNLMETCEDKKLADEVRNKCYSIVNMLYYLNDLRGEGCKND